MTHSEVDLNADMGESFGRWTLGDDSGLLRIVTSANIACGFHAGDPATLVNTCRTAVERGVAIGAHVGYRDVAGFGRRFIDMDPDDLFADVLYQIGALDGIARSCGGRVAYVKPHGALYNTVVHHAEQARAVVRAVVAYEQDLALLGLPGSILLDVGLSRGLRTVREAFADRAYTAQGTLVSRREPASVLHDPEVVAARVVRMVTQARLTAVDGTEIALEADSVCVHGDSPDAVTMAAAVRRSLEAAGVLLSPFVR
ncbi:MAG: 5-oxoprolinase subunit PxpA [Actinomycetota bacterium]